jgi:hypothetical protein
MVFTPSATAISGCKEFFALFAKGKYSNYLLALSLFSVIVPLVLVIDPPAVKSREEFPSERFTTRSMMNKRRLQKTQTSSHKKYGKVKLDAKGKYLKSNRSVCGIPAFLTCYDLVFHTPFTQTSCPFDRTTLTVINRRNRFGFPKKGSHSTCCFDFFFVVCLN